MIDDDGDFFCVFELDVKTDTAYDYYLPHLWDFEDQKFLSHNVIAIRKFPRNWKVAKDDEVLCEYLKAKGMLTEWLMTRIKT